jgi:cysteine desulfurase
VKAYLDNLATTAIDPRVLQTMMPHLAGPPGNPHSTAHPFGAAAHEAVEAARAESAAALGVTPGEVVFTSGATAANNLVVLGVAEARARKGRHVLVTAIEHPSVLESARSLRRDGAEVEEIPVGEAGFVDPDEVRKRLRPDTVLVSVMAVNNEVGTIQPVSAIAEALRGSGARLHCDAAQAPGKVAMDFARVVDYLTVSGHKAYGPKSIAALVIRKGAPRPRPILYGGGQEDGLWPGTVNAAAVVGLARALRLAVDERDGDCRRVAALASRLWEGLVGVFPGSQRNGDPARCVPQCLSVRLEGIAGETLLSALARAGVAASLGSACATESAEPSHVLTAMGLSRTEARRTLRFGLGRFTTLDDVEAALEVARAYTPR